MKRVLVTGATGFIGGHVVSALLERGYEVCALVRPGGRVNAKHPGLSVAAGDVRDRTSLDTAVAGCEAVIHTAALYSFWVRDASVIYDINVGGTRNVLGAAVAAGAERIVYTSTVSTIRTRPDGGATEADAASPEDLVGDYKRSKWEAERIAMRMASSGAPVIVVNPTAPVGPADVKPTPLGQLIVDFLRRAMPAFVDTGLNLVDVRDVAEGHILALEKGRPSQRYLLGHQQGNLTLAEILGKLSAITGLPAPRLRLPHTLTLAAAHVDTLVEGALLGRPPRIPLEGTRMARKTMWVNPSKAIGELGLPQRPVDEALRKAVEWFKANGYTARRPQRVAGMGAV